MTEPGVDTAGSPGGVIGKVQGSDGWPVEHAVVTVADAGGRQLRCVTDQ